MYFVVGFAILAVIVPFFAYTLSWKRRADRVLMQFIRIGDQDTTKSDEWIKEEVLRQRYAADPTCKEHYRQYLESNEAFKQSQYYKPDLGNDNDHTTAVIAACIWSCLQIERHPYYKVVSKNPSNIEGALIKIARRVDRRIDRMLSRRR